MSGYLRVVADDGSVLEDSDQLLSEATGVLRKLSRCPDLTDSARLAFEKAGRLASVLGRGKSPAGFRRTER